MALVPPLPPHLPKHQIGDIDEPRQDRPAGGRRHARRDCRGSGLRPLEAPPSPPSRLGAPQLRFLRLCAAAPRPHLQRLDRKRAPLQPVAGLAGLRTLPEQALIRSTPPAVQPAAAFLARPNSRFVYFNSSR